MSKYATAADRLKKGGVIAYPTEAVYGLGCDPLNETAAHQLLALKNRCISKGVILIGASWAQLVDYVTPLSDEVLARILCSSDLKELGRNKQNKPQNGAVYAGMTNFIENIPQTSKAADIPTWPGPVTWLLPASTHTPPWIKGAHDTIAVRVTAHPVAKALCEAFGGAIVSTSANLGGEPPAKTAEEVKKIFDEDVYIVTGAVGDLPKPTDIRDGLTGELIRG
jgi:L-threonylcarbamoyladenylate synthase